MGILFWEYVEYNQSLGLETKPQMHIHLLQSCLLLKRPRETWEKKVISSIWKAVIAREGKLQDSSKGNNLEEKKINGKKIWPFPTN